MKEKENVETTKMIVSETNQNSIIQGMNAFSNSSNIKKQIITSITDEKVLFNLETNCDYLINDCIGEKIRVKDFVCKIYEKPLKEPIVDDETGEIIKDKEFSMSTILIDDNGKSYATGSKPFFFQFKQLCMLYEEKIKDGVDIQIINIPVKNSNNKSLGFKLL